MRQIGIFREKTERILEDSSYIHIVTQSIGHQIAIGFHLIHLGYDIGLLLTVDNLRYNQFHTQTIGQSFAVDGYRNVIGLSLIHI